MEAIAPDAAALRLMDVARRMDCGSSWTLLRITAVAVVDVGRAQVAARSVGSPLRVRLPTGFPLHSRDASPQLRHEIWSRTARACFPPSLGFPWILLDFGGRAARALRDQISWRNCGEASRSEVETTVGSLTLGGPPAHLAATCALPTSTTATAVILSNVQDEPQSIRLATCLDRGALPRPGQLQR